MTFYYVASFGFATYGLLARDPKMAAVGALFAFASVAYEAVQVWSGRTKKDKHD